MNMITFFKRTAKNEVEETNDKKEAIYFSTNADGGTLHPISSLTDEIVAANSGNNIHLDVNGEVVTNVPANDSNLPEPLLMPSMNFDKKEKEDKIKADDGEHLPLPIMKF